MWSGGSSPRLRQERPLALGRELAGGAIIASVPSAPHWTATANRARSDGVVQSPAAASSG